MRRLRVSATAAIISVLLFSGSAHAAQESWYSYWGIGWVSNSYPDDLPDVVNDFKNNPAAKTSYSICWDIFGTYWPLPNDKSVLGIVLNAAGDRFSLNGEWLQQNFYLLGLSAMHFFGYEPGAGFFLRADAGMALNYYYSSLDKSDGSDIGYGGLVGTGYGIPISESERILLNLNYAWRSVEGSNSSSLGVSVGILF
jgi:hypothetical protein